MEKIQINRNTRVYGSLKLFIFDILEKNNELCIVLADNSYQNVNVGDTIYFKRYIQDYSGKYFTISKPITIKRKEGNTIYTDILESEKIYLTQKNANGNYVHISGITSTNEEFNYYVLKMASEHNFFAQDLEFGQEIYIKDIDGKLLYTSNKNYIPKIGINDICKIEDAVTYISKDKTCGENKENFIETYKYTFLPDNFSRKNIIISDIDVENIDEILENMVYIEYKFNPFYYYVIKDGELDEYGNPIKHCKFYYDIWLDTINLGYFKANIINSGHTSCQIVIDNSFWKTNIFLNNNFDDSNLGNEDFIGKKLLEDTKNALIPDVIDMERLQYSPVINNNGNITPATSLTIDMHFRQRVLNDDESNNTELTSGYTYKDGWYINPESGDTIWWNGCNSSSSSLTTDIKNFIQNNGTKSDLLGYLNFIDNDVFYRKKKVNKSFIRLLFFNSKDLINQKLLFYSTIFLDGTNLYSNYIKQLLFIEDNPDLVSYSYTGNPNALTVFCDNNDMSGRVDTKIIVTNEFNKNKSSEGFNLYLFSSDSEIKDIDENGDEKDYRTIYMKVEFNHAGNGKIIPLIMWPKKNGEYVSLTTDNFIDSLYIPVKIQYFNNKYVYYIDSAINNNDNIELVLFEPKLDYFEMITE